MKKVVPKTKIVKKFPEFLESKIYVVERSNTLDKIVRNGAGYYLIGIDTDYISCSHRSFEEIAKCLKNIYILDNQQDLANFIMGCRELPKVEEIEETVNKPLADDEIYINDCDENKIYAMFQRGITCILTEIDSNTCSFVDLAVRSFIMQSSKSLKDALDEAINQNGYEVYEFDTEKEFLEQAYKWVTGESIQTVDETKIAVDKKQLYKILEYYKLCSKDFSLKGDCNLSCLNCRRLTVGLEVQE